MPKAKQLLTTSTQCCIVWFECVSSNWLSTQSIFLGNTHACILRAMNFYVDTLILTQSLLTNVSIYQST